MSYISRKMVQSTILVGLICAPVTALAADFAPPPPVGKAIPYVPPLQYRWDGFYLGINGGGAFGSSKWDLAGSNSFNTAAWMAGATLGYNFQFTRMVIGIEGDFDYVSGGGSTTLGGCAATCTLDHNYLGTVRGRIGWALDRFFPFFTAGVAFGDIKASRVGVASSSNWQIGYVVGAGLEVVAWDNWTVKSEYLFVNLGDYACSPACGAAPTNNVNYYTNLFRLGLNYRF